MILEKIMQREHATKPKLIISLFALSFIFMTAWPFCFRSLVQAMATTTRAWLGSPGPASAWWPWNSWALRVGEGHRMPSSVSTMCLGGNSKKNIFILNMGVGESRESHEGRWLIGQYWNRLYSNKSSNLKSPFLKLHLGEISGWIMGSIDGRYLINAGNTILVSLISWLRLRITWIQKEAHLRCCRR